MYTRVDQRKPGGGQRLRPRTLLTAGVLGLLAVALTTAGLTPAWAAPASPGVDKGTITLGLLYDATGPASSTFGDSLGAVKAELDVQNAAGGIDGRKLKLVSADTETSPTQAATAAEDLVSVDHVFGVIAVSAVTSGAAKYLQQQGVPVTGQEIDAPEWDQQPNTNMFILTPSSPTAGLFSLWVAGPFWKAVGAKKISLVASNTGGSLEDQSGAKVSIMRAGLSTCDDTVVPLGTVNFSTYTLSVKSAGCDAVVCSCVTSSALALATSLKQAGLGDVKVLFEAGPDPAILASKQNTAAADGAYFQSAADYLSPAGQAFEADLKKYDPSYTGGVPDLGSFSGWTAAALMVKGLQEAGQNPTRSSFITNLRKVKDYTVNGLLPLGQSYDQFGKAPSTVCYSYSRLQGSKYVPVPSDGKAVCGTLTQSQIAASET